MDQDAFRKLLTENKPFSRPRTDVAPTLPRHLRRAPAQETVSSSSGFQPRGIDKDKKKQNQSTYRDRAADRRANDTTEPSVEGADSKDAAVANGTADGSRTEGPPPVKGLDIAQVEQSKLSISTAEDDDILETAFQESKAKSETKPETADSKTTGQKRTRDDIILKLKEKRARSDTSKDGSSNSAFEKAKQLGKFKPIGAPDVPSPSPKTKLKRQSEDGAEAGQPKQKKRKKASSSATDGKQKTEPKAESHEVAVVREESKPAPVQVSFPSSHLDVDEDIDEDIFADVGDYNGVDLGDDEEDDEENDVTKEKDDDNIEEELPVPGPQNRWFEDDEPASTGAGAGPSQPPVPGHRSAQLPTPSPPPEQEVSESTSSMPTRLQPLSSSSMPSIRDFLDVEKMTDVYEKRQAKKKAKKSNKEKGDQEGRIDRDYQKLNSFMKTKGS